MDHQIKKPKDDNQLDDLVLGMVNMMRFSDPNVLYPKHKNLKPDDGVDPEWLYPALEGSLTAPSEQSAVYQYIKQAALYPDLGELLLGIGITEMKHLDKISDTIIALGGTIKTKWDNSQIDYGTDKLSALKANIEGEKISIEFYSSMIDKLSNINTASANICAELLAKLEADEKVHLAVFEKALADINKSKPTKAS